MTRTSHASLRLTLSSAAWPRPSCPCHREECRGPDGPVGSPGRVRDREPRPARPPQASLSTRPESPAARGALGVGARDVTPPPRPPPPRGALGTLPPPPAPMTAQWAEVRVRVRPTAVHGVAVGRRQTPFVACFPHVRGTTRGCGGDGGAPRQARSEVARGNAPCTHGLRPRCHPGPGPAQRRHLEVGQASSLAHPNAWQLCPSRSRSQTLWGHPGPLSFLHTSRPSHLWVLLALPLNTPRVQPISLCPLLPSALEVPSSLPRGLPASAPAHDCPLLLQPEQLRLHHVTMQDAPPAQGKRQRSRGPRSWSPRSPSCSLLP